MEKSNPNQAVPRQPEYTGRFSFSDALGILFIGLKLVGQIDWSWWWVLAPVWVKLIFVIIYSFNDALRKELAKK